MKTSCWFIPFYHRPRSEGDNALGSIRPSVRLFVCALTAEKRNYREVLISDGEIYSDAELTS